MPWWSGCSGRRNRRRRDGCGPNRMRVLWDLLRRLWLLDMGLVLGLRGRWQVLLLRLRTVLWLRVRLRGRRNLSMSMSREVML